MPPRRSGGSQSTVPPRKRKKGPSRKETAYSRAVDLLGEETVKQIGEQWATWDTGVGGKEWQQSEGVVLQLLQQGLSERVIRAIIPVSGSRITRLRKVLENGIDTMHTRRERPKPWHAFSEADLAKFKSHCSTWILEDGFPCPHRRPRQYFTEPKLTWLIVHARYEDDLKRSNPKARTLSYSWFRHYIQFHYPGVRLTRTEEDACDCCVQLDIQLQQTDLSDDERNALVMKKKMHIDAAIGQRRFVSSFIKTYTAIHAPEQNVSEEIIPDTYEDGPGDHLNLPGHEGRVACNVEDATTPDAVEPSPTQHCRVLIQAEDYGGGIPMPHYGHIRPSADYFKSNLILQNFVVANISGNINNVYFYDEQAQGKNADALCSIRLLYHLSTLKNDLSNGDQAAEVSFSLLDNCVGQNKSKAVLMFFVFLSVVFPYKKVVVCFLLPGHSHNIADRVIAWCRRATKGLNLYTSQALVEEVNKVKSVNGIFLDHNNPEHPFFVGWNELLSKFFASPPAGYTANYLFEIDFGHCTARKTVDTPDEDSISFAMIGPSNVDAIRKAVLADLFGPEVSSIFEASIASVRLPRHPLKELSVKKKNSLSAKYFSIPPQHLGYYPEVPDAIVNAGVQTNDLGNEKKETSDEKQKTTTGPTPQDHW